MGDFLAAHKAAGFVTQRAMGGKHAPCPLTQNTAALKTNPQWGILNPTQPHQQELSPSTLYITLPKQV